MRFVMMGAGAIGGVVGGQLARAGFETILVDPLRAHVEAINRDGLRLRGVHGAHVLRIPAVTDLAAAGLRDGDVVFSAVKSYQTDAAMQALRRAAGPDVPVFCAQNGIRNEEVAGRYNGEIVRLGRQHGIPTPLNTLLLELITEMARARERPGKFTIRDLRARLRGETRV